ncbi:MAG: SCO family protein [Hyphomonadaceae bacterium]
MSQKPRQTPPKPRLRDAIIPTIAAVLIGGAGAYYFLGRSAPDELANLGERPAACIIDPPAEIGGPIALEDVNGRDVTQADFAGNPALVYFGFTHCPDICPNTMYVLADALEALGPDARSLQPVLITLDPERDTTDVMQDYIQTADFPPGLVGLTGTPDQVAAAAREFAVNSMRAGEGPSYTINHTSFLYVMDGAWRPKAMVSTIGQTPQQIAACIRDGLGADLSR